MSISLKHKVTQLRLKDQLFKVFDFNLMVNDSFFDPDLNTNESLAIQTLIQQIYWNTLRSMYQEDCILLIKLSGLHFNIDDAKPYALSSMGKSHCIIHYHSWPANDGACEEVSFAIIECDKQLLCELLVKYWFALGFELRFEGIAVYPANVARIKKWSSKDDSKRKYNELLGMSALLFDNKENGFHFRITVREERCSIVERGIQNLLKMHQS